MFPIDHEVHEAGDPFAIGERAAESDDLVIDQRDDGGGSRCAEHAHGAGAVLCESRPAFRAREAYDAVDVARMELLVRNVGRHQTITARFGRSAT
jgi:hypothetical protein